MSGEIVLTLSDGRMFIPLQTVIDWPDDLRHWMMGPNNYWERVDWDIQGFISPAADLAQGPMVPNADETGEKE